MTRKAEDILQDAHVKETVSGVVKSLQATRAGRAGLSVIVLVLIVGLVWVNAELAGAPAPSDKSTPIATEQQVSGGIAVLSDAVHQAAVLDTSRGTQGQQAHLDPSTFDQVTVRHVIDGDTLAVARGSGDQVSVRLIGMDTPESVAFDKERNCAEGVLASDHMKELVAKGDTLWLQYDTSQTDRYDRPLAYVWRELPSTAQEADNPAVIAAGMLNAIQVIDGYGQARTYRPDTYHDNLFAAWGAEAASDHRGVTAKWA